MIYKKYIIHIQFIFMLLYFVLLTLDDILQYSTTKYTTTCFLYISIPENTVYRLLCLGLKKRVCMKSIQNDAWQSRCLWRIRRWHARTRLVAGGSTQEPRSEAGSLLRTAYEKKKIILAFGRLFSTFWDPICINIVALESPGHLLFLKLFINLGDMMSLFFATSKKVVMSSSGNIL